MVFTKNAVVTRCLYNNNLGMDPTFYTLRLKVNEF